MAEQTVQVIIIIIIFLNRLVVVWEKKKDLSPNDLCYPNSNESTKTAAYSSLIRPILEYCCTVWNPHTQEYINKLEMVQRRAARYVTNRYHNTNVGPPWMGIPGS